jgi:hypothetical protein
MLRGRHESRQFRGIRGAALVLAVVTPLAVVAAGLARPDPVSASGGGSTGNRQVVETTINIPALVVENLCNLDTVVLSGDAHIRVVTTQHRNGGYTVQSSMRAPNLTGQRINPPPMDYEGSDAENSHSYYAPPPQPSTHTVVHWTKLVPQGRAPTMWLVIVFRQTIQPDGTPIVTVDRAFLVCKPPSRK